MIDRCGRNIDYLRIDVYKRQDLEGKLSGKKVALFGSYDWGDGEWMRTWCGRAKDAGAELVDDEGLIVNNTPDDEGLAACRDVYKRQQ